MDLLHIAPIGCLVTGLQVNAFGSLLAIMAINATVIYVFFAFYGVSKGNVLLTRATISQEKSQK